MTSTSPRDVETIEELLEILSLVAMKPFEHSALLTEQPETTDPSGQPKEAPADTGDAGPTADTSLGFSDYLSETEMHLRFRLQVKHAGATYVADIASVYLMSEPIALNRSVLIEFAERVGIMSVFPYLRESISTSAARMGLTAPLVGLLRPGDFRIEPPAETRNDDE